MATDLQTERGQLQSQLKQSNDKITSWFSEEARQLYNSQDHRQQAVRQKGKDEMTQVNVYLESHKKEQSQKVQELEERCGQLEQLQLELERLSHQHQDLQLSKKQRQAVAESLRSDVDTVKQEIEAPNKTKQKLEYLQKASNVFGEMLGLTFKKTRGNRMQVIFTQIDEADPTTMFYFFLQIQGAGRKYIASDCEPAIEGVEALVTRLNETNNFRAFMLAMRNKFKETINK